MFSRQSTLQVGEHLVEAVAPVFAVHGTGELPALVAPEVVTGILLDVGLEHVEATTGDIEFLIPLRRHRDRTELQPVDAASRPGHMAIVHLCVQEL